MVLVRRGGAHYMNEGYAMSTIDPHALRQSVADSTPERRRSGVLKQPDKPREIRRKRWTRRELDASDLGLVRIVAEPSDEILAEVFGHTGGNPEKPFRGGAARVYAVGSVHAVPRENLESFIDRFGDVLYDVTPTG